MGYTIFFLFETVSDSGRILNAEISNLLHESERKEWTFSLFSDDQSVKIFT